jgi:hypothetical protein
MELYILFIMFRVQSKIYNYIFKDSTEYTGLEYWIREKVLSDHIEWFPLIE